MSDVCGVGGARRFSLDEEEALRRDEPTNGILGRDTKAKVAIQGDDLSWRETKAHQQEHVGLHGGAEIGLTGFHGLEMIGAAPHVAVLSVLGPLAAFGAGIYGLAEAEANGEEQARARAKDYVHVALIAALDLPAACKQERLEGAYSHVPTGHQSRAGTMAFALNSDPKGLAVMQLHADRGMHAARDLVASGMTAEAFFKANPKVADGWAKDAAFHEGFQAFVHAKTRLPPAEARAMEARLLERDCRYSASQISVRV